MNYKLIINTVLISIFLLHCGGDNNTTSPNEVTKQKLDEKKQEVPIADTSKKNNNSPSEVKKDDEENPANYIHPSYIPNKDYKKNIAKYKVFDAEVIDILKNNEKWDFKMSVDDFKNWNIAHPIIVAIKKGHVIIRDKDGELYYTKNGENWYLTKNQIGVSKIAGVTMREDINLKEINLIEKIDKFNRLLLCTENHLGINLDVSRHALKHPNHRAAKLSYRSELTTYAVYLDLLDFKECSEELISNLKAHPKINVAVLIKSNTEEKMYNIDTEYKKTIAKYKVSKAEIINILKNNEKWYFKMSLNDFKNWNIAHPIIVAYKTGHTIIRDKDGDLYYTKNREDWFITKNHIGIWDYKNFRPQKKHWPKEAYDKTDISHRATGGTGILPYAVFALKEKDEFTNLILSKGDKDALGVNPSVVNYLEFKETARMTFDSFFILNSKKVPAKIIEILNKNSNSEIGVLFHSTC